jgi:S1-C subfamily serine protease
VVVVEDVHWADEGMLAFLDFLAQSTAAVPLLVLATGRQEVLELTGGGAAFVAAAARVPLGALSGDETAQLVLARLGAKSLSVKLQGTLLERSGGNPLFAEELVRLLQDRDLLVTRGGQMMLREGAEVPTPDSIGALIAARLDVLSPERKALLADASVVGRTFWAGAVTAVGEAEPAQVYQGLMELVAKELVRPERASSMEGETEFVFVHALVRDVAYGQLTRTDRAQKHAALARWLEERTAGRTEDLAEILAYHYGTALEMATACGLDDLEDELAEPTTRYLELAGGRAQPLDAAAAAAHFARAERVADQAARPKRRWGLSRRTRRRLRRRAPLLIAAAAVLAVAAVAALAIYEFRPQRATASGPVKLTDTQIADKYGTSVVDVVVKVPEVIDHKVRWSTVTQAGVTAPNGLVFTSGDPLTYSSLKWHAPVAKIGIYSRGGHYRSVFARRFDLGPYRDIAIFKVDPKKAQLQTIPIGDPLSMRSGDWAVALSRISTDIKSTPSTILDVTRSKNNAGRDVAVAFTVFSDIRDLRVGGPLVDSTGHLMAVMGNYHEGKVGGVLGRDAAVAVTVFTNAAAWYQRDGDKWPTPWLGVRLRTVHAPADKALGPVAHSGALIEFVAPGSPAARAGLRGGTRVVRSNLPVSRTTGGPLSKIRTTKPLVVVGGDVIAAIDGVPVSKVGDLADYIANKAKAGEVAKIRFFRGDRQKTVKAKLVPNTIWSAPWF